MDPDANLNQQPSAWDGVQNGPTPYTQEAIASVGGDVFEGAAVVPGWSDDLETTRTVTKVDPETGETKEIPTSIGVIIEQAHYAA